MQAVEPEIVEISAVEAEVWDAVWSECDYATWFHSRYWAELWRHYDPARHSPAARLITFSDGMQAVLPLVATRHARGIIQVLESSAWNTYGGWISRDPLTIFHGHAIVEYMRRLPNLNWMTNPFDPLTCELEAAWFGDASPELSCTHALDLRKGLGALSKRTAQYYRAAKRNGLALRRLGEGHLADFMEVYEENQVRWEGETMSFSPQLFLALLQEKGVEFHGVYRDERLLAAGVALCAKKHIALWIGVARPESLKKRPMQFLDGALVEHYAERGYRWYDLHPSGDRPNLEKAKKLTGAVSLPIRIIRQSNAAYRASHWLNQVLAKMPQAAEVHVRKS